MLNVNLENYAILFGHFTLSLFYVLGAVYTCPNLRANRHTFLCAIHQETKKGSNSFSVTHYNSLFTHFSKQIKNYLAGQLWQQIVHQIVWGFVWEIARVDSPLCMQFCKKKKLL
jgi:hypothetical protein